MVMITEPIWEHIKRDHLVGCRSIFVREMRLPKVASLQSQVRDNARDLIVDCIRLLRLSMRTDHRVQ